jgi:hypothetical protein
MNNHNIRDIYTYNGPEAPLGDVPVTVTAMTIDKLDVISGIASAQGTFSIMDHAEGCPGSDPWVANGILDGQKFNWVVMRMAPRAGDFCFSGEDGEPLFTLLSSVNDAIKAFVAVKLDYVLAELEKNPSATKIEEKPKVFEGPVHKYTGPCVCTELRESNSQRPFNWDVHTNAGQFPKNCFQCSCGQYWYRADDERWVHVGDEETWQMLTIHDGEVVEQVGIDPECIDVPTITLMKNIRQRGFIPIG